MTKYLLTISLVFLVSSSVLFGQHSMDSLCQNRADVLVDLDIFNQPDHAIDVVQTLLPILLEHQCWENYAECYNVLSAAYYYKRDYQKAKENAEQAMLVASMHEGIELMYAAAIANYSVFVDVDQSIALQKKSLELEREFGNDEEALAYALEGLGLSYQQIGDYDIAIDYFKQAIEKVGGHEQARLLRQIATCYQPQKQTHAVFANLEKSIAILDALPAEKYYQQTKWYAYKDMAETYLKSGDTHKARNYIEKAIRFQEGHELLEQYQSWLTYGAVYLEEGKVEKAMMCFQQAREEAEKEFDYYQYHIGLAQPHAAIARAHAANADYEQALAAYQKALEYLALDFKDPDVRQNPSNDDYINKLEALEVLEGKALACSAFYEATQDMTLLQAAHDTWLMAAQLIHRIRLEYLTEQSKYVLSEKTHSLYLSAIENALRLYDLSGEAVYFRDAFMFAESNKAVSLYESVKSETAKKNVGISQKMLQKERNLQAELAFYEFNLLEEKQKKVLGAKPLMKEWQQKIFQLKEALQANEQLMEENYPQYLSLKKQIEPVSLKYLQAQLPDKTAIVEFALGEELGHVFFLTQKEQYSFPIPGSKTLHKEVESFSQLLTHAPTTSKKFKKDFDLFQQWSNQLYEQLLAKGLERLPKRIDRLVFIPDGLLNYLPFDLLVSSSAAKNTNEFYKALNYLFYDYDLSYNYSASMVVLDRSVSDANKRRGLFLGLAPSFGESTTTTRSCDEEALYGLYCNQEEVQKINDLISGKVYTGSKASIENFEKEIQNYEILHLATHACIHEEEIALNKIFFSEGTYLTQSQLDQVELSNNLTVLSACNSGSGKLQQGEGVMSLARCFLMAGSQSVLTSLWSIDDCSTSAMMFNYYQQLFAGVSKDEAIAIAKKEYLQSADLNNSHPYYWGAFVQFGNLAPLNNLATTHNYYFIIGLGFLVVGLFLGWRRIGKSS